MSLQSTYFIEHSIQKIINDENDKDYKVILMSSEYNQEKLELNED